MWFRSCSLLLTLLASLLLATGCAPRDPGVFTPEVEDRDYRRGKELLRQDRNQEALSAFLKVIAERGEGAPESHLEAAILYQKHIKDPIAAIYHYRKFRELKPNSQQADLVRQQIEAATREFARTLPARPLENQAIRSDVYDTLDQLQRENLLLKEQVAEARQALLDATRNSGGTIAVIDPSQSALVPVQPVPVETPQAPVTITPRPTPPPAAPTPPPAPAGAFRRHTVVKGDTLFSLAQRYYGNRSRWRDIYAANRDVMPSENALSIGMELKIPQ
ncbi:MAG: LysM domain-containing protein [Verrucomicrobiota bacterium]